MGKKNNIKDLFSSKDSKVNAYKKLEANLRFIYAEKPVKTIAITSASKNEGKTTVSTNLAKTFAEDGLNTLLIDADISHKSIVRALFDKEYFCVMDLINKGNGLRIEDVIYKGPFDNLFMLDCATGVVSISSLASSNAFMQLLNIFKENFDVIIFDTPPILSGSDSSVLCSLVDSTIICVRNKKAKTEDIKNTIEQLKIAKANIDGFVLTFSEKLQYKNYY